MSAALRLLLAAGLIAVLALMVFQPRKLRRFARQIRLVGFVYVVAVLTNAVLRLTGVLGGL
ncbi:MAG: hypothetical protein U0360_06800 [Dehalococcoidia bacterium]